MLNETNHSGKNDEFNYYTGGHPAFPSHFHRCFEVFHMLCGTLTVTVDNTDYALGAGMNLLIFPNQMHSYRDGSEDCLYVVCIFSPELVSRFTALCRGTAPKSALFCAPESLFDHREQREFANIFMVKGFLYQLCGSFFESASLQPAAVKNDSLTDKILCFIEENYAQDCTLSSLSAYLKYDYSYLSKIFLRTMGISFNRYVTQYRLLCACRMLQENETPVHTVALQCGFRCTRSFNRTFMREYGVSPGQYRKDRKTAAPAIQPPASS